MSPFTNTQFLTLGIATLAVCTLLSLALAFFGTRWRLPSLLWALVAALVLRAVCSTSTDGAAYDIFSYSIVGHSLASGIDIFTPPALFRQNYPPAIAWWFALDSLVTPPGNNHLFAAIAKLPFWVGDSMIVLVLGEIVLGGKARLAAWFYALNPIAIAISSVHGQFDSLVVLGMLIAWGGMAGKGLWRGVIAGAAGAFKSWAFFFLPVLWPRLGLRQSIRVTGVAVLVPVAVFAFYRLWFPSHLADGLSRIIGYVGVPQNIGSGAVLGAGPGPVLDLVIGSFLVVIAIRGSRQKFDTLYMLALSMLVVLSISPLISAQYYVWPIAFTLAVGYWRTTVLLTVGVMPFLIGAEYFNFQGLVSPVDIVVLAKIAWLVTVVVTGFLWMRPKLEDVEVGTGSRSTQIARPA